MANVSTIQAPRQLTTDFKSTLLPLYSTRDTHRALTDTATPTQRIGPLALNIYSPREQIPHYEKLLCQEMASRQSDYDIHQSVKSFWFSGSPLKQLSPEAITELCFRFSNHFPHSNELNTIRGISVSASELNKPSIALLAGLKFNCVKIYVDASIAGKDRSLSRIQAGLEMLADYEHIKLNFKIRLSDQCHPDFLMGLVKLLQNTAYQQIELVYKQSKATQPASDTDDSKHLLVQINEYLSEHDWVSCGNNCYYAPQHENYGLHKNRKLHLTPWGYDNQAIQTRLGVGAGALSLIGPRYELNTIDPEAYRHCIGAKKNLPVTHYQLNNTYIGLAQRLQTLVCYKQIHVDAEDNASADILTSMINQGWLSQPNAGVFKLTNGGLVNLNALTKQLISSAKFSHLNFASK